MLARRGTLPGRNATDCINARPSDRSRPTHKPAHSHLHSFYSSYQGIKYVSRVARDEDDWGNPVTAALCTVAPLMVSATFRRNVPYALLLIGMDVVSEASSSSSS